MECELMNKNRAVLKIIGELSYNGKGINLPIITATEVQVLDKDFCPLCIVYPKPVKREEPVQRLTEVEAFNEWFKKRLISDKRPDVPKREDMAANWITSDTIKRPNFFSLTDQYWIRYDKYETWDKLNFFTNKFNPLNGEFFLSINQKALSEIKYVYNSPDITTNGIQPKRWIQDSETQKSYLYKYLNNEKDLSVLSEIIASKHLKKLNCIDFVNYQFGITNYCLCSKAECFINEHEEFVPASHLYYVEVPETGEDKYVHLIRMCEKMHVPDVIEFIDMMITVDRMMLNFDRHLGNFGFIRNVETGRFERPAPLFDFGSAFFLTEKTEKELSEMSAHHYFYNREKKLIRDGIIKTAPLFEIPEEVQLLPINMDGRLARINENIVLSNNYITSLCVESEKNKHRPHSSKGKQHSGTKEVPNYDFFENV